MSPLEVLGWFGLVVAVGMVLWILVAALGPSEDEWDRDE